MSRSTPVLFVSARRKSPGVVPGLEGEEALLGWRTLDCKPETAHRFARCTTDRPITSISYCYFAILSDITRTSFLCA
jgi:hypothetical protein